MVEPLFSHLPRHSNDGKNADVTRTQPGLGPLSRSLFGHKKPFVCVRRIVRLGRGRYRVNDVDIVNILRRMVFFRKLTEAGSGDARQGRRPALPAPRSRADRWQYTTALCVASAHSRRHSTLETRPPPPRPSPPPPSPHQCVALYDVQDAHGDDALMSLLASHAMRSALAPSSTAMRRARAL